MDTLGSIRPASVSAHQASQRAEAFERLRYLALQKRCGVLLGERGSGKSAMLSHLRLELAREGVEASCLRLAGVEPREIPQLIAAELGLGISANSSFLATWTLLHEYAAASAQSGNSHIFLFDQIDRVDAGATAIFERLLTMFDQSFACLFASRPKYHREFHVLFKNHAWLKIELGRMNRQEISQTLAKEFSHSENDLQVTSEAVDVIQEMTQGRMDKIRRLTELAALAAEAEEIRVLNEEVIRSLMGELSLK